MRRKTASRKKARGKKREGFPVICSAMGRNERHVAFSHSSRENEYETAESPTQYQARRSAHYKTFYRWAGTPHGGTQTSSQLFISSSTEAKRANVLRQFQRATGWSANNNPPEQEVRVCVRTMRVRSSECRISSTA